MLGMWTPGWPTELRSTRDLSASESHREPQPVESHEDVQRTIFPSGAEVVVLVVARVEHAVGAGLVLHRLARHVTGGAA